MSDYENPVRFEPGRITYIAGRQADLRTLRAEVVELRDESHLPHPDRTSAEVFTRVATLNEVIRLINKCLGKDEE